MNKKRFAGFVLILAGMLISFSRLALTGAAIGVARSSVISAIGATIVFVGIILILTEERVGELERKIIRTAHFDKSIKKYDSKPIEHAIKNIGTGRGHEEYIKQENAYSIRASKGARVMFQKDNDKITLERYLPPSKHY